MLERTPAYRLYRMGRVGFSARRRYRRLSRRPAGRRPSEADWNAVHERTAQDLHDLTVELGGLFIKLCQVIGARADVFPEPYSRILGRFHDAVPPRPFAELKPSIERELGGPIADIFDGVDPIPLASASLAQVHRARLKDGTEVVLKVQYPEIAQLVRADLSSIRTVSKRFMPRSNLFDPQGLIEEMSHFLDLELDFSSEAASTERVRKAYLDDPRVRVPKVYTRHSTSKLLVLEFLDGIPLTDVKRLDESDIDQRAFLENVAALYGKMIFEDGFFHGDPHPGNLLALDGGVIGLLDFGLAKELPDGFGASMAAMFARSYAGDNVGALEAARDLGFNIDELSPALVKQLVERTMGESRQTTDRKGFPSRKQREAGKSRQKELELLARGGEPLRVPPHFALVSRTMMLLDGLSHRLAPGEKIVQRTLAKAIAPYAMTALRESKS